jgi:hypothetical protein
MQVITLAKVKALLGIADTSSDTAITAAIPYVDSAVKYLTRNRYNYRAIGATTLDSYEVKLTSVVSPKFITPTGYSKPLDDLEEYIMTGQLISGTGIPADTYIAEVYYNFPSGVVIGDDFTLTVDLSAKATATADAVDVYLGIPIALQPTIAKGVWWHVQQLNTTITDDTWKSKSMGKVSVTRGGDADKIDGNSGMPMWFVQTFKRYHGGH